MQIHTKIYLDYFDIQYDIDTGFCDVVECTIKGDDCTGFMFEVHHIDPKGMGGNPNLSREVIENYIGSCRDCHNESHDGVHSMERLYDLQAAKMMRHIQKKINKIMDKILEAIKSFFKAHGTVHHGRTDEFFKLNLLGNVFVFWNCRTSNVTKLEGRDLFDKDTGFSGRVLKTYVCPASKKFICTPEELKQLHDDIKLIYLPIKKIV